jgi:hypothetical protein
LVRAAIQQARTATNRHYEQTRADQLEGTDLGAAPRRGKLAVRLLRTRGA